MPNSRLFSIVNEAIYLFREKAAGIRDGSFEIESPDRDKQVQVKKTMIHTALNVICPRETAQYLEDFTRHFNDVRGYIPLCSSPTSFRTAWDLRSESINVWDANTIVNSGGQVIPINPNSRLLQWNEQGVELGINKRLILAVRHSEGNYEDKMDDLARFIYQPPNNVAGMLRYRWCQFLSSRLGIPYILLAVMWFKILEPIGKQITHYFVLAPAKIIDYDDDLADLNESLHHPLQLQIITREEALVHLNRLFALNETDFSVEARNALSEQLAREWAYDKINNTERGRQIKRWAQGVGKRCPGSLCKSGKEHIPFKDLSMSEIAFGHIIPQKWAKVFSYLLEKVDHPDNLYLTCKNCNSSLSDAFPDTRLKEIITSKEYGTIGDWLRSNESEIRGIQRIEGAK